ncbi:MAG: GTPase [Burkholderiales bacterium RIFCSPHIGHO2_12_FULL_65_48]|nr:MAG: GTPase [Burkholderiales bacterium RIFCSPHIGHO2_02_FULL_64_19]OGB20269.1 MAG: GTPase [Burkholderiales bacterium RIFCSPHIGHO2_12_FULL_65_48]OGB57566.1 MAG: GTPase [Burkholderiales bacterium RIFCSPLOWO2_12_FULL_64_33]
MNLDQQKSILTIALLAAFADGNKDDAEREEIRRIAQSLAGDAGMADLPRIYQEVLLRRTSVQAAVQALSDPMHRQLAYEMAVCVCDVDGRQTAAEREFLNGLKTALQLGAPQTDAFDREADAIVDVAEKAVPLSVPVSAPIAVPVATAAAAPSSALDAELDKSILNYALLNGALELLPQSWASMAIIPMQVKMVYGIGKAHGVELDQGHIKEFIAAAGVGMTSQYLEQFGRKLLGGLLGKAAGRTIGGLGSAATGMAFSFATTYALGQVAKRYYAGGRVMSTAMLRDTFQNLLGPAKQMQSQYLPQIQQKAATLDAGKIMAMVRGA